MVVFFARLISASLTAAAREVPGLVHGDLKPSNMLMMWGNVPLISDFGTARAAAHGLRGDALLGTRAYCSPLAQDPTAELSVLDDVYSYGVILEELLTGSRRKSDRPGTARNAPIYSSVTRVWADLLALARQCRAESPPERPGDFSIILDKLNLIAPEDQWPIPNQVEMIPNPVVSPHRINSVAQTLVLLEEFDSALEFIAGTNSKTRPWGLWGYQGMAFSGINKPAHARASLRQAKFARMAQTTEAESYSRELDLIMYFFALTHRQDKPRKAAKILRRLAVTSVEPEIAKGATYSLAAIYTEIGRFREAEWLLQQLGSETEDALVWNQLGTIYLRLKEFERAVNAYQRAIELAPLNPLFYNSLGQALLSIPGRAGEALRVLERAIDSGDLSLGTLLHALIAAYLIEDAQAKYRLRLLVLRRFGHESGKINTRILKKTNRLVLEAAVRLRNGDTPHFRRARIDKRWEKRNSLGIAPMSTRECSLFLNSWLILLSGHPNRTGRWPHAALLN